MDDKNILEMTFMPTEALLKEVKGMQEDISNCMSIVSEQSKIHVSNKNAHSLLKHELDNVLSNLNCKLNRAINDIKEGK